MRLIEIEGEPNSPIMKFNLELKNFWPLNIPAST